MASSLDREPRLPSMIDVREVASILSISTRSVWRLVATGELPQPVRFGRSARWRLADIEAWIEIRAGGSRNGETRRPR
jgi:prophage regulatory protein